MYRTSLTALVTAVALAIAPGALAHQRHHHPRKHHVKTHFERFGTQSSGQPGTPAAAPAGTISGFTSNGELTITLASGSVTGLVTNRTEIECPMAADNDNDDGVMNTEDHGPGGGDNSGDNRGDDNGDNNDNGDQNDGENGNMCSTTALTIGATVQEARLEISSAGAVWERIELQ